jgi:hypothetical protein
MGSGQNARCRNYLLHCARSAASRASIARRRDCAATEVTIEAMTKSSTAAPRIGQAYRTFGLAAVPCHKEIQYDITEAELPLARLQWAKESR